MCDRGQCPFPLLSPISVSLWEQCEKWIGGMPRVMCNDLCNACDGSVIGIWQTGSCEANDFVGSVCNVYLFLLETVDMVNM